MNEVAYDADGNPLPYSDDEVREHVRRALSDGTLLLVVLITPHGDIAVHCTTPPSPIVADAFDAIAVTYRRDLVRRSPGRV